MISILSINKTILTNNIYIFTKQFSIILKKTLKKKVKYNAWLFLRYHNEVNCNNPSENKLKFKTFFKKSFSFCIKTIGFF